MSNLTGRAVEFKSPELVSPAIRKSAKGQRCCLRLSCCNNDPETTVFAHFRRFGWGGTGQKPLDILGCYACSDCHDAIDGRARAGGELWEWEDLLRAMGETLSILYAKGILLINDRMHQ